MSTTNPRKVPPGALPFLPRLAAAMIAALLTTLLGVPCARANAPADETANGTSGPGPSDSAALELEPCFKGGLSEALRCGSLDARENPDDPDSRTISLEIAILLARSPDPAPDPLFILAGGPGQAATRMIPFAAHAFDAVREHRDLVFVDQRGTGKSNPLACELGTEAVFNDTERLGEMLGACLRTLEQKADLRRYTTFHAMPDLDRVRAALGYQSINLWGGSYGTRAAMVYQALYPEHTRAVVLDGTAPFATRLPMFYARDAQRAFDRLLEDCAADPGCAARYVDLGTTFASLLERLERQPAELAVPHPRTGEPLEGTLDRAAFTGALRGILYSAERAGLVPFLVERAAAGDFAPLLAAALQMVDGTSATMSLGMTFAVLCSEDYPRIDRTEADAVAAGTFLGSEGLALWHTACALWPRAELPDGFEQLAPSKVPALLLSGDLDPVTPPTWGEATLELFPQGRHLVVPGTGHNTSHVGCVPRLIADFLDTADAASLDASCVEKVVRPPFVVGFQGVEP